MLVHGMSPSPHMVDFTAAFWMVTAISMTLATIWNLRFAHDAGAEISGRAPAAPRRTRRHRRRRRDRLKGFDVTGGDA